jgi:hypothetical protein
MTNSLDKFLVFCLRIKKDNNEKTFNFTLTQLL